MTEKDLLNAKFDERKFGQFVTELLPDFKKERKVIPSNKILRKIQILGTSEACRLVVITARIEQSQAKKRMAITQEAFRILRQHRIRNALVAFYAEDENWRLSLLTSTLKIDQGRVVGKTSNPRRYSYLLGPKAKVKTPRKFLIGQGQVMSLEELKERFSVEVVNKQFYNAIATQYNKLVGPKCGREKAQLKMPEEAPGGAAEFAVRLIGRLIFCWFLKEKQSAAGLNLMPDSLVSVKAAQRHPEYYHNVLEKVFFGCLNTKFAQRDEALRRAPFDQIPYLNGGLFNPQANDFYEQTRQVKIDDVWFVEFFEVLSQYNFTVDENTNLDVDLSIDPEMLGRIFENLLAEIDPNTGESARKATGSFYTPREIVSYMVDEALKRFLAQKTKIDTAKISDLLNYEKTDDVKLTDMEREKIVEALAELKILDPACGSGAFPIGILQKVFYVLQEVDPDAERWYHAQKQLPSSAEVAEDLRLKFNNGNYDYIRKLGIIQRSIFGVDIQPIATEIAKLRCFLTLVIEEKVDDTKSNRGIHPLPNLDFKFVTANTLKFLPENPNDPFNMFETGESVDLVKKVRNDYFMADRAGRIFLKTEFGEAQSELAVSNPELAAERYRNLVKWQPFINKETDWFDSEWMFGVKKFDIVIGNPPYGASLTRQEQDYCLKHYKTARSEEGLKGSLDTFGLFIERGLDLLKTGGSLVYIVPMAVASNEAMTALQNKLEQSCERIYIASFANRPKQIFDNACVRSSILLAEKTDTPTQALYMTKPIRRASDMSIREVIESLEFVEAYRYKMEGRYPKVSNAREVEILDKIFRTGKCVGDYVENWVEGCAEGRFYYRAAGGRYFNIVTLEPSGVSAEREYRAKFAVLIAACMSTSLFWFYQQVYTDGLNLKGYEVDQFPLPDFEKVDAGNLGKIKDCYLRYLEDIERNANIKSVGEESRYNVQQFKEYKVARSKKLIDELDDLIDPLYELSRDEVDYIKNYEEKVRLGA